MRYFILFVKKTLRYLLKPLSFIPAIVMMYAIFHFSAQQGEESAGLSRRVSEIIAVIYNKVMDKNYDALSLELFVIQIHPYVRKIAHVTEYFLLAMSVCLPLYVYRIRGIALMILGFAICVSYAVLDEYHQTYVVGRTGDYHDVLIDSIGIIAGIIVIRIIGFTGRKTIFSWLSLDD